MNDKPPHKTYFNMASTQGNMQPCLFYLFLLARTIRFGCSSKTRGPPFSRAFLATASGVTPPNVQGHATTTPSSSTAAQAANLPSPHLPCLRFPAGRPTHHQSAFANLLQYLSCNMAALVSLHGSSPLDPSRFPTTWNVQSLWSRQHNRCPIAMLPRHMPRNQGKHQRLHECRSL